MKKLIQRPGLFVVSILCFFLPFCDISCSANGKKIPIGTVSGFDLVVGKQIQKPENRGVVRNNDITIQSSWAALTLLAALAGLGSYFMNITEDKKRKWAKRSAILGAFCLFFLLFFSESWYRYVRDMPLIFRFRLGFYLSWFSLIAAAVMNWRREVTSVLDVETADNVE
ncbi:hypothetical protein [Nibrella viscosa]|uniref:hypothetical protein n=1 Tax=Nibrella viscosa TaxID=1084524 RepID=UPI0031E78D62